MARSLVVGLGIDWFGPENIYVIASSLSNNTENKVNLEIALNPLMQIKKGDFKPLMTKNPPSLVILIHSRLASH